MRRRLFSLPLGLVAALLLLASLGQACSDSSSDSGDSSDTGQSQGGKGGKGQGGKGGSGGQGQGGSSASGHAGVGNDGGIVLDDAGFDPDAFFINDPPPPSCDGGGGPPPVIGGTPDCPSDKNREGCPCTTPGQKAPCWPGYRKNRNRGICKDGTTTCVAVNETSSKWDKCEGYVLPNPNGTTSKEKCLCFSGGQWKLNNLSPCFVSDAQKNVVGAVSTIETGPGQAKCPPIGAGPLKAPDEPFSTTTLTVDCAGHFKLCYTLRAGKAETASPSDCIMAQVCSEADYSSVDQAQPFPPLSSWVTSTPEQIACAKQFASTGGYGEMTVVGLSVECDQVPDQVFNRVNYCPLECNSNPSAPGCANCMNGGSGNF